MDDDFLFCRARYSRMMEEGFFRNKPADYVWLMLFSAGLLIILSVKYIMEERKFVSKINFKYCNILDYCTICLFTVYGICAFVHHGLYLG